MLESGHIADLIERARAGTLKLPDLVIQSNEDINGMSEHVQKALREKVDNAVVTIVQARPNDESGTSPADSADTGCHRLADRSEGSGETILFALYRYQRMDPFCKLFSNPTWVRFMRKHGVLDAVFGGQTLWARMCKEHGMYGSTVGAAAPCLIRALADMNVRVAGHSLAHSIKLFLAVLPGSTRPVQASERVREGSPQSRPAAGEVFSAGEGVKFVIENGKIFYTGDTSDGLPNPNVGKVHDAQPWWELLTVPTLSPVHSGIAVGLAAAAIVAFAFGRRT